jgi:hypothetical protein
MEEFECANCGHKVMRMMGESVHFERTLIQILMFSRSCKCGCDKPAAPMLGDEVK